MEMEVEVDVWLLFETYLKTWVAANGLFSLSLFHKLVLCIITLDIK